MTNHISGLAHAWAIADCPVALAYTSASAFNSRNDDHPHGVRTIGRLAHVRPPSRPRCPCRHHQVLPSVSTGSTPVRSRHHFHAPRRRTSTYDPHTPLNSSWECCRAAEWAVEAVAPRRTRVAAQCSRSTCARRSERACATSTRGCPTGTSSEAGSMVRLRLAWKASTTAARTKEATLVGRLPASPRRSLSSRPYVEQRSTCVPYSMNAAMLHVSRPTCCRQRLAQSHRPRCSQHP